MADIFAQPEKYDWGGEMSAETLENRLPRDHPSDFEFSAYDGNRKVRALPIILGRYVLELRPIGGLGAPSPEPEAEKEQTPILSGLSPAWGW